MLVRSITVDEDDWKEFKRITDNRGMSKTLRSLIRKFIADTKENDPAYNTSVNEQQQGHATVGQASDSHGRAAPSIDDLRNLDNEQNSQSSDNDDGEDSENGTEVVEDDNDSFWKPEFTYE
jgi:hypothetical protein